MCALVGTRAVPYIGWTEQLRRREHFAGAPCNIRVLLRRQLQAMQRFVHMPKVLSTGKPCLFCGRTFAALHENGSECDVAKNGSWECATPVVKGVRDPCRGGVPGEGVQLGVCGLWVGV